MSKNAPLQDGASLVDAAYQDMRRRILDNVWAPGYQALEQEIALQLGMSRTPVREALIRLANEGLVEVIPRRGMRVLPVSPTDMKEIYEILGALESMAAEMLAARKPSDAELKPLITATKAMEKALARDDLDAWAAADESFHEQLVNMAGNKLLAEAVFTHWDRAHRARMFTLRLRPKPVNSTKEHMALVDRLREGDAAGAAAVNREHRQRASRELLAIFERFRLQQM
ncbi:MAG: GntR family transcriptional regulator [Ramlibacter sp.]|nr:GntR family transcriptional regulator [Ramlibacter sp.]